MFAFIMTGYTVIAQNTLKDVPQEDPPLAVEKLDVKFDELKIFTSNGELNVSYVYPKFGNVTIEVFDIAGREIVHENT